MALLATRTQIGEPLLVIVPSVPAACNGDLLLLDDKAVSGLYLYSDLWPGRVRCIFREGPASALLFGHWHESGAFPFDIVIVPQASAIPDILFNNAAVVLASGDNYLDFALAKPCQASGVPIIFTIEYTLETRLKIIALSDLSFMKKLKSSAWSIKSEFERRFAFRRAQALQANGIPAAEVYKQINRQIITYFDSRLSEAQMATDLEIAVKQSKVRSGAPLRLIFTGRLEKMKGADDLIRIAAGLQRAGRDFCLDIYGSGSLQPEMSAAALQFDGKVRIHAAVDFNRELVPILRTRSDIFLCCHRQSDPSCTYLETLGCGVPIIGYANRAWDGILKMADVGWKTATNSPEEIVRKVIDLDIDRALLSEKIPQARDFGKRHSFEAEFKRRVDHLSIIANVRHASERQN